MKKKYKILNLLNPYAIVIVVLFFSTIIKAQQNVYNRSDSGTNLWWNDTQKPWYYQSWNSIENRPDIWPVGTRNDVYIGHNNNTLMNINGSFFQLRTLTIQTSASANRVYNAIDNGGISLSIGYNKQLGSGNQNFNVPIGIDGSQVTFLAQDGITSFNNDIYLNTNNAIFEGSGDFNINGIIQGEGSIIKNGQGTLVFSGSNTYTGSTTINAGVMQFNNNNGFTIPVTNSITINSSATLKISSNQTLNTLHLNGGILEIDEGVVLTVSNFNYSTGSIIGLGNLITTPEITSNLLAFGTLNSPFSYNITADYSPANFTAVGLPLGLSIDSFTGFITGIPSEVGEFSVSITASNVVGSSTKTLQISILPTVSIRDLHCGSIITPYQWIFSQKIDGVSTYRYNVYDATGTDLLFSVDRNVPYFRFYGNEFTYGSTYQVKVQVKPRLGEFGVEGSSCNVTLQDVPVAALQASHCGSTVDPYQWLFSSQVAGATEYRFNVYDATGLTLLFSVDRNVNNFRFFGNEFTYGSTYQVKVQARQGEVYGDEGTACSVTIQGLPTSSINANHCGSTVTPHQWIFTSQVAGATGYRFTIYDATGTNLLFTIESSVSYFRFLGSAFSYGTTYQVRVQSKQGEVYSAEGTSCSITLSGMPTTSLNASHCGSVVTAYQIMFASQVAGATEYRFNIYDSTGTNLLFSIDRNVASFRFLGSSFIAGTTYSVGVQAKQGLVYGTEGSRCTITLSGPPTTAIESAQCGTSILYTDAIYAVSVSDATGYKFNVYNQAGTTLVTSFESATNWFSFSQLTGYTFDTTYQVRVQVIRGTEYGVEGTACSITVLKDAPARALSNQDEIKTSIVSEFKAYPNPFTTTFSITPMEGETATLFYQVYDVTGKMMESRSVEANEITNHTIGEQYPAGMYLVIVRQGANTQTFKMVKQ